MKSILFIAIGLLVATFASGSNNMTSKPDEPVKNAAGICLGYYE